MELAPFITMDGSQGFDEKLTGLGSGGPPWRKQKQYKKQSDWLALLFQTAVWNCLFTGPNRASAERRKGCVQEARE